MLCAILSGSTHLARCLTGWKGFAGVATIHRWQEIDPLLPVYGDKAVRSALGFTHGLSKSRQTGLSATTVTR
jgi:hypothetical protein